MTPLGGEIVTEECVTDYAAWQQFGPAAKKTRMSIARRSLESAKDHPCFIELQRFIDHKSSNASLKSNPNSAEQEELRPETWSNRSSTATLDSLAILGREVYCNVKTGHRKSPDASAASTPTSRFKTYGRCESWPYNAGSIIHSHVSKLKHGRHGKHGVSIRVLKSLRLHGYCPWMARIGYPPWLEPLRKGLVSPIWMTDSERLSIWSGERAASRTSIVAAAAKSFQKKKLKRASKGSFGLPQPSRPLPQRIVLSLGDGIGCLALALKKLGYKDCTRYLAVEKSPTSRMIASHANPEKDHFPGMDHGWHSDVYDITEEDISSFPKGSILLVGAGPECGDFSKLRLLPDRDGFKGPKTFGDARKGLNGTTGKMFTKVIEIIEWVMKHHPSASYIVENVVFNDMDDWATVCDKLGTPKLIDGEDVSFTHRYRAFWTNLRIPVDYLSHCKALEANDCLDEGRQAQRYESYGKPHVRPLGGSYTAGSDENPASTSKRRLLVDDSAYDTPQEVRAHEAEQLMGLEKDCTKAPDVTTRDRLNAIGKGWDINMVNAVLKFILPEHQTLRDKAMALASTLPMELPLEESQYQRLLVGYNDTDQEGFVAHLKERSETNMIHALALLEHHRVYATMKSMGSILDSGSSQHLSRDVMVTDPSDLTCLSGFEGSTTWTKGSGHLSLLLKTESNEDVPMIIEGAQCTPSTIASILSMGKLIKEGWSFDINQKAQVATTPSGAKVNLRIRGDDIIELPHATLESESVTNDNIFHLKRGVSSITSRFLHHTFNHASAERIHKTLQVTMGYTVPTAMLPGLLCNSCAIARLRRKGLSQTRNSIFRVLETDRPFANGEHCYDEYQSDTNEESSADSDNDRSQDYCLVTDALAENVPLDYDESDGTDSEPDSDGDETLVSYEAPVAGTSGTGSVPRYVATELRPFEIMFCDWKDYDIVQQGGYTCTFIITCAGKGSKFAYDAKTHKSAGLCFQTHVSKHGIHKLPYPVTVYSDGCGSMNIMRDAAIRLGINHVFTPPHEQSLNEAEKVVDQLFSVARALMIQKNVPPKLFRFAVKYAMYVDLRMASSVSKGGKTPYEAITGSPPDVSHMRPFYSKTYVTAPKAKRAQLLKQGNHHARAEVGYFLGYQDTYGSVAAVILSNNRIVHSINVLIDTQEYSGEVTPTPSIAGGKTDQISADDPTWDHIPIDERHYLPPPLESDGGDQVSRGRSFERAQAEGLYSEALPGPGNDDDDASRPPQSCNDTNNPLPSRLYQSPSPDNQSEKIDSIPTVPADGTRRSARVTEKPHFFTPHEDKMESISENDILHAIHSPQAKLTPRGKLIQTIDDLQRLDFNPKAHQEAITDAIRDHCLLETVCTVKASKDPSLYIQVAANLALHAQKDMSWQKVLVGPDRNKAIEASEKEFGSLQESILKEILPSHPDYEKAKNQSTTARELLDIKRSGEYKARIVKQGFKENKTMADGPNFNYYSHVARLSTVRMAILRPDRKGRSIAMKDVSTAFLQSHKFPDGMHKYLSVKDPVKMTWRYFEQSGPIYGESSAPIHWENTIAPWLESQGFKRGENEMSAFTHKEKDILVVLYVDDILADGPIKAIEWFFDVLNKRFKCKEADFLTPETPLDYLGMKVSQVNDEIYITMDDYIENCLMKLELPESKISQLPITESIEGKGVSPLLSPAARHYFLTALGMAGWLSSTARPDISYAVSRIGQHAADPTESALKAIKKVFYYLQGTKRLGLKSSSSETARDEPWEFYCDSDYAGNSESQNKRRSQIGICATINRAPIYWSSKVSSVCFANADLEEAHADMSSAAVEIYGAGNATIEFLHLSYVSDEMGISFPKPIVLQIDNTAAIVFANATAVKTTLKHIDVRQHWVRLLRNKKLILPKWVHSPDNLADIFTKILTALVFLTLRNQMMFELPQ